MTSKLIIFDFDGVLADSFDTFYSLIRDAMGHIGLKLTEVQYRNFFIGNVHQGFRDFIKDRDRYSIFSEFRMVNYDKYYNAKLFPGTIEFLKKIRKGYSLTIASSGRVSNITNLLRKNNVDDLFDPILADSAYSKEAMIKKILAKFNRKPEKVIMISDTVGDIRVAKKIGLTTIAVSWGFHSAQILRLEKPDFLANSFKTLYKNIKAF